MPSFVIEDFVKVERNTLRGFARVRTPSGIVFHDVSIHQQADATWASPASKPLLNRDGQHMKGADGKALWMPIISFASRELREPPFAVDALFDHLEIVGALHDPCCGLGTIPDAAMRRDILATGADIADRANGRFGVRDFLIDTAIYPNIVCNPPYQNRQALVFVLHALDRVPPGGSVAVLVLPPGELLQKHGEAIRGNGSTDFCWVAWRRGRTEGAPRIVWAAP